MNNSMRRVSTVFVIFVSLYSALSASSDRYSRAFKEATTRITIVPELDPIDEVVHLYPNPLHVDAFKVYLDPEKNSMERVKSRVEEKQSDAESVSLQPSIRVNCKGELSCSSPSSVVNPSGGYSPANGKSATGHRKDLAAADETPILVEEDDAENPILVKENNAETPILVKDEDAEKRILVKEDDAETPILVKDEDAENPILIKDEDAENLVLVKNKKYINESEVWEEASSSAERSESIEESSSWNQHHQHHQHRFTRRLTNADEESSGEQSPKVPSSLERESSPDAEAGYNLEKERHDISQTILSLAQLLGHATTEDLRREGNEDGNHAGDTELMIETPEVDQPQEISPESVKDDTQNSEDRLDVEEVVVADVQDDVTPDLEKSEDPAVQNEELTEDNVERGTQSALSKEIYPGEESGEGTQAEAQDTIREESSTAGSSDRSDLHDIADESVMSSSSGHDREMSAVEVQPITNEKEKARPITEEEEEEEEEVQPITEVEKKVRPIVEEEEVQPITEEEKEVQPIAEEEVEVQLITEEEKEVQPIAEEEVDVQPITEEEKEVQPIAEEEVEARPITEEEKEVQPKVDDSIAVVETSKSDDEANRVDTESLRIDEESIRTDDTTMHYESPDGFGTSQVQDLSVDSSDQSKDSTEHPDQDRDILETDPLGNQSSERKEHLDLDQEISLHSSHQTQDSAAVEQVDGLQEIEKDSSQSQESTEHVHQTQELAAHASQSQESIEHLGQLQEIKTHASESQENTEHLDQPRDVTDHHSDHSHEIGQSKETDQSHDSVAELEQEFVPSEHNQNDDQAENHPRPELDPEVETEPQHQVEEKEKENETGNENENAKDMHHEVPPNEVLDLDKPEDEVEEGAHEAEDEEVVPSGEVVNGGPMEERIDDPEFSSRSGGSSNLFEGEEESKHSEDISHGREMDQLKMGHTDEKVSVVLDGSKEDPDTIPPAVPHLETSEEETVGETESWISQTGQESGVEEIVTETDKVTLEEIPSGGEDDMGHHVNKTTSKVSQENTISRFVHPNGGAKVFGVWVLAVIFSIVYCLQYTCCQPTVQLPVVVSQDPMLAKNKRASGRPPLPSKPSKKTRPQIKWAKSSWA